MSWTAVVVLALGAYGFKALGVFGLASVGERETTSGPIGLFPALVGLIPAALFAALIAVQTLAVDESLQLDARIAGVVAAAVAVRRRAPFVVVVVVAMAVTALIRWQT